jgi:hypothetical protein
MGPIIGIICFLFGVFGLATYPVGLQLSAECTFPVSETTSTGLIVISGQIQSILYLAVMKYFAKPLVPKYPKIEVCSNPEIIQDLNYNVTTETCALSKIATTPVEAQDMTISVIV